MAMYAFSITPFPLTYHPPLLNYGSSRTSALRATRFRGASLQIVRPSVDNRHSHRPMQIPKCFSDPPDDDEEDEGEEEVEIILTDPRTNRTLPAGIERAVTHEGKNYVLCYPMDDPVTFARTSDKNLLQTVEDEALVQKMFRNAEAVLAEEHVALKNTAFFMTIDDQGEDLGGEDEDEEEEEEEEHQAGEDEPVEVIGEFLYEGVQHFVVRPMITVLLLAEELEDGYRVLEGKDLEAVSPFIEKHIDNLDTRVA